MKVLITGAGGFIGSHLTERCVELGYDVKAFIHYNANNHWGWLESSEIKNDVEIVSGDIRDFDSVYSAMQGVDTVFHLAALIGIPYSYASPLAYIRTNIEGGYNVLQSAKMLDTQNILMTSTSETYGTAQYIPIDEQHPNVGQSPYSATKISSDQIALSYWLSFKSPVKIVRPFNTFGPRQSSRAVIPAIISQALADEKQIKLGSLSPTRDFTFVKDTVDGFIEIYKSEKLFGEVTNIGTNTEITISDLAIKIFHLLGKKDLLIQDDDKRVRPENSEVQRLYCDNTKLIEFTNWKPKFTLDRGLMETINWIQSNQSFYKTEIYHV